MTSDVPVSEVTGTARVDRGSERREGGGREEEKETEARKRRGRGRLGLLTRTRTRDSEVEEGTLREGLGESEGQSESLRVTSS